MAFRVHSFGLAKHYSCEYRVSTVNNVTHRLNVGSSEDPKEAEKLLPLVYEELRRLAAAKMASECSGQTLQPTALVHEAFIKLTGGNEAKSWNSRKHFYATAAEAMRQILIDCARRKSAARRGAGERPLPIDGIELPHPMPPETVLKVDDALLLLESEDPELARLVKLRFFAGFSEAEIASILEISERSVQRKWAYARAWLFECMSNASP